MVTDSQETQRILFCSSRNRGVENSKKSDAPLALLFDLLFHPSVKSQSETERAHLGQLLHLFDFLMLEMLPTVKKKKQQTRSIRFLLINELTAHGTLTGSKGAKRLKGTVKHVT